MMPASENWPIGPGPESTLDRQPDTALATNLLPGMQTSGSTSRQIERQGGRVLKLAKRGRKPGVEDE